MTIKQYYQRCLDLLLRRSWSLLQDFSQAVPLVPLAEANEDAMENRRFLKLLRKLGLRAPADEQVGCFWNI